MLTVPAECATRFLKSANTPHLKSGCEPRLLFAAGMLAFFPVLWTGMSRYGIALSIFVFLFVRAVARRMALEDPYMTVVLGEAQKYKRSYPRVPLQALRVRLCR